ncbi:MAG: hypothetical protein ONB44_10320 [candidate division KSB1 bacterium]|nr:hypothetical protein [candidate division KSB1 bacterium]MDZ7302519.1 hypothetical protein [candidate division KSB1 bacterium]MDZ7311886.1 hypothetical protein [candidate division KSB1 bacterium]
MPNVEQIPIIANSLAHDRTVTISIIAAVTILLFVILPLAAALIGHYDKIRIKVGRKEINLEKSNTRRKFPKHQKNLSKKKSGILVIPIH